MPAALSFLRPTPSHRALAFDLVRVYLGVGLLARGVVFITQPAAFYGLLDVADPAFSAAAIAHYVALAHLAGGLLLALGLLTRLAALVQIPILAGATAFVHLQEGLASPGQGLELASLVLVLLIAYAVYGGGALSLDHLISREDSEEEPRPYRVAERPLLEGEVTPGVPAASGLTETRGSCVHTRDRSHPRVTVERSYGIGGALRFISGTTGRPSQIVFRCRDCGGVAEASDHPEDLAYYTYHEEKRPKGTRSRRLRAKHLL